ncbi:outer membrane protein [Larkinella arboricola]|uniref:Outer membrane protein n=1 Tax=Larkinella arboricola TaxID=643671 RepID=A0A327WHL7_LARAB|nr:outer membrane beta-barrel protein [Larkinella arboricola]RAJ89778.1 outer membrane protein [Larkinella arboricola]
MKKAGLTLLLLTIGLNTMAQTQKGRWLLGAQVGDFSYRKFKGNRGHSFSVDLAPTAGYFIANNLLVALTVPYSLQRTRYQSIPDAALSRQIGLGPSVRYYLGKAKLKPFAGLSYAYSWAKSRAVSTDLSLSLPTNRFFTSTLSPNLGLAYFINRNVALNAGLNYNVSTEKGYSTSATSPDPDNNRYSFQQKTLTLGVGFSILLGNE